MPDSPVIGVTLDPTRGGHRHRAQWVGIRRYAEERDWRLALDPFAETLPAGSYDGVITHGPPSHRPRQYAIPVVCLTPAQKTGGMSRITPDYHRAGRLAARHLVERDYANLAVFSTNHDYPSWLQSDAFRKTARRKGWHLESMIFGRRRYPTQATWPRFSAALDKWVRKVETPVGVFVTDDLFARRLADACLRAGLRVPDDVAIVGDGNDPVLCEGPAPSLTSIDLDYEAVGTLAAATLGELLDAGSLGTVHRRVPPLGVVPRRSTDRLFFDEPAVTAALGWIARHCHEPIRVSDVADGVGVPAWTLRRLMRQARRHTVAHAIARARLQRAMSLLESTDLRIELVAERAGYTNRRVMTAAFTEHLHMPPRAYRQAAQPGGPISVQRSWSPIVHAKQLLRETAHPVPHIALVTGYTTENRLTKAFRRHTGTTPGVWRSIHGTPAVKKLTAEPEPPWPRQVTVTFYDQDGKEMD